MEQPTGSLLQLLSRAERGQNEPGLFSSESVLDVLKLILAGSPLSEVLAVIAQLVESQGEGTLCTIWLPDGDEKQIHCAAAPSLPGFSARVGPTFVSPKGASCGTAVYRREPVYVTDILSDSLWDDYRDPISPYGIRAVWSRPLVSGEGKELGELSGRGQFEKCAALGLGDAFIGNLRRAIKVSVRGLNDEIGPRSLRTRVATDTTSAGESK